MKLTVLGAGCWGLTLAWLLTNNFDEITVWGRQQDLTEDLVQNKHASKPLEVQLSNKVEITSDMTSAIENADIILNVVATSGTRDVCENLKKSGIKPEQILVNASKGIELPSLMRMSEVIKDVLPEQKLAILSGPTLAKEVLQGKPTAACVASEDMTTAEFVQHALLYGLSGMGDLIATCSSPMSRNYTVGSMLGKGKKIDDILRELGSVAEGVKTSKAICELAKKLDIDVPVSNAIYEAVYTDITPQELLDKLMNRKLKEEERYV